MPVDSKAPDNHTLFWIYWHDVEGNTVTFDTLDPNDYSNPLAVAIEDGKEYLRLYKSAYFHVYYGNASGAFTELDPAYSSRF